MRCNGRSNELRTTEDLAAKNAKRRKKREGNLTAKNSKERKDFGTRRLSSLAGLGGGALPRSTSANRWLF